MEKSSTSQTSGPVDGLFVDDESSEREGRKSNLPHQAKCFIPLSQTLKINRSNKDLRRRRRRK
jgi:hypothetical protein